MLTLEKTNLKSQINYLTSHLIKKNKKQFKSKEYKQKETKKILATINDIKKIKRVKKKINETKNWFFEKISIIDKPLARVTQKKKKKTFTETSTRMLLATLFTIAQNWKQPNCSTKIE